MSKYSCYILECGDGSFYTGSTSNLELRIAQHEQAIFPKCYTASRRPIKLVWQQNFKNPDDMVAAERKLKGWSHPKKQALIDERFKLLSGLSKKKFND